MGLVAVVGLAAAASADPVDKRFSKQIKDAATAYKKWGRVDDAPKVAPTACAAMPMPSHGRISDAPDSAHDKKLYFLWASDKDGYLDLASSDKAIPTGFAIVKESFSTKVLDKEPSSSTSEPQLYARKDGKILGIDKPKDLFVMVKDGGKDGTDDGWVYGTVAVDGTVTSAGRVDSCMNCHDTVKKEKLFGLKR